jgi:HopA1 effector protein family
MMPAIASVNQANLATYKFEFRRQLENVVAKIAIAPNFTITYEDLEPLEVESRLRTYLKQISATDLNQYLTAKLQKYLYSIFSTRVSLAPLDSLSQTKNLQDLPKANYANKWSKTKFYQELTQNNHGQGYEDPGWLLTAQVGEQWLVTKNELTLHIQPRHLIEPSAELSSGKLVSLRMPPSLVERGIYIAVGDAGSVNNPNNLGCTEDTINQLYFNVGTEGALCLLDNLTQKLNQARVPFDFKINYNEAEFDQFDAVILEFRSTDSAKIYSVVKTAYQDHQADFHPEIPFFCKLIAPGWGFAEKPRELKFPQENVGRRCCGIIAKALVTQWQNNKLNNQSNNKLNYVLHNLSKEGVDIEHLYLNPNLN